MNIEFVWYVFFAYRNYDNFNSTKSNDNNIVAGINENDDDENIRGSLDNLYKFYSIYN